MKQYFSGKTGCLFWLNVLLAISVVVAIPVVIYFTIDGYTHHGEKLDVPMVVGERDYKGIKLLEKAGLEPVVTDSVYRKGAKPGCILDQNPKAGTIVKTGHVVHLTINLHGAPMVKLPDLAGNSSRRQAEVILKDMGFKLTAPIMITGRPKDLVIAIKQGTREILAGQNVNKEKPLTLVCGGGEEEDFIDSLDVDSFYEANREFMADTAEIERNKFDIAL